MGYGAAIAWLLFALVLALTLALFGFARKRVYYAGGER
jgi:ABC-type sugar transport system permease subunit